MNKQDLKLFVDWSLDIHESKEIQDLALVKILQEADPEESLYHIEFPGEYNKSSYPVLWHIRQWKESAEAFFKRKKRAEHERQVLAEREEALRKLTASIMKETGLDREQCAFLAYKLLQKNADVAKLAFGVDITNVPTWKDDQFLINRITDKT